ncbi:MAG: GCN5-related N-acetyltransferase [Segetibacter sp.]|nr:GCN5-related N-acetyltransferase [Segetibacter sp.]
MKILEASLADVSAICLLVNSADRGDTSRKGWTTEADLLDGIRVDEVMLDEYLRDSVDGENIIVASVYLKKKQEQLHVGMLMVSPELQAKGIGKLLLKASEEKAKDLGCKSIVMTVITSRSELIAWYKRHGYNETGERQPFPANERFGKPKMQLEFVVMEKTI